MPINIPLLIFGLMRDVIRKNSQSHCLIAQIPSKFIKWDRDMSDDSIALFLDTECMTFF